MLVRHNEPGAASDPYPVLSAIIIARGDRSVIGEVVEAVVGQRCQEPFEVLVVTSGSDGTGEFVQDRFPEVGVISLSQPVLPGAARNAGLANARGHIISFPGSHIRLTDGSLQARIRAHRQGYDLVTGSVLNGTPTCSGWAAYFFAESACLPGRPSGPLDRPPAHCSYTRRSLEAVGGFPNVRTGEDTIVNALLFESGYAALRCAGIRIVHRSPCRNPLRLVRHHFLRGRGHARALAHGAPSPAQALLYWVCEQQFTTLARFVRVSKNVRRWGRNLSPIYWRVFPLVLLANLSWWSGAWYHFVVSLGRPVSLEDATGSATDGVPQ